MDHVISPDAAALILTCAGLFGIPAARTFTLVLQRAMGFGSVGVVQRNFAAWWQSAMPLVAHGSLWTALQSIAGDVRCTHGAGTIGRLAGFGLGEGILHFELLSAVCKRVDDEVAKCSAAGRAIQANAKAVRAALRAIGVVTRPHSTINTHVEEKLGEAARRAAAAIQLVEPGGRTWPWPWGFFSRM